MLLEYPSRGIRVCTSRQYGMCVCEFMLKTCAATIANLNSLQLFQLDCERKENAYCIRFDRFAFIRFRSQFSLFAKWSEAVSEMKRTHHKEKRLRPCSHMHGKHKSCPDHFLVFIHPPPSPPCNVSVSNDIFVVASELGA